MIGSSWKSKTNLCKKPTKQLKCESNSSKKVQIPYILVYLGDVFRYDLFWRQTSEKRYPRVLVLTDLSIHRGVGEMINSGIIVIHVAVKCPHNIDTICPQR